VKGGKLSERVRPRYIKDNCRFSVADCQWGLTTYASISSKLF
jgi:hypothetical protein